MMKRKRKKKTKQRSTKHYTENERSSNSNHLRNGDRLRFSGRVDSSIMELD